MTELGLSILESITRVAREMPGGSKGVPSPLAGSRQPHGAA